MTKRRKLILDNDPQVHLFDALSKQCALDNRVIQVIQRGSFAKNESDRASDIDVLLVADDESVGSLLKELDAMIGKVCTVLTPYGWVDTIVPDFGGVGFVYLVKYEDRLIQLDVYITPASWAKRIHDLQEKVVLYTRPGYMAEYICSEKPRKIINTFIKKADTDFQITFEFLLLYVMLTKHIYRSRPTLAVKYRYALTESLAIFLRMIFVPHKIDYKMYDWHADFKDISAPTVRKYERIITQSDAYSVEEMQELMNIFKTVLYESAHEHLYSDFSPLIKEVENYTTCLLSADY